MLVLITSFLFCFIGLVNSLFGCFAISSQLVLNSTTLYTILFRHWNGPCEPMCRKAILKSNQNQIHRIGGTLSEIYDQEEGVPQGSILAVTLFSIKNNSIMKCLGNGRPSLAKSERAEKWS